MSATLVPALLIALQAGAAAEAAEPAPACLPDGSGYLIARLGGAVEADLDWKQPELECSGMARPDGKGLRLRFAGPVDGGGRLAIVFAPPVLAEGEDARAVPVNVTVLDEAGGRIFGTRGEERCLLDEVTQQRLASDDEGSRVWAVEARGFCTGPARAVDDRGNVILTRFDFRGRVTLRGEPPAPPGRSDAP